MQDRNLSPAELSAYQVHLDKLKWVKIKAHLIYSRELSVRLRVDRIWLSMLDGMVLSGSGKLPKVTARVFSRLTGLSESAAKRSLKKLVELGLVKDGKPAWPGQQGLAALDPNPTYVPRKSKKSPSGWFHQAPRLLVGQLSEPALLIYFHLKHKELQYWAEVRKERRSSTSEIVKALRMSRRDAVAGIKELESLGVVDWRDGDFILHGVHAGNVNKFRCHGWIPDDDLVLLRSLGFRHHTLDISARRWFDEFAPDAEVQWFEDAAGTSFWYTSDPDEGVDLVHPADVAWDALGVHPLWGYGPAGLHPCGGNEEIETKINLRSHEATPQEEYSSPCFSPRWTELVPPFMSIGFLRRAGKGGDAATWLALWFGAMVRLAGSESRVTDDTSWSRCHRSFQRDGTTLANVTLAVIEKSGVTEPTLVRRSVAALIHFFTQRPSEYITGRVVEKDAHHDRLPLFWFMVDVACGAAGVDPEGAEGVEIELAGSYAGRQAGISDYDATFAIFSRLDLFGLEGRLRFSAAKQVQAQIRERWHPVSFLWEHALKIRRRSSIVHPRAYLEAVWNERVDTVADQVVCDIRYFLRELQRRRWRLSSLPTYGFEDSDIAGLWRCVRPLQDAAPVEDPLHDEEKTEIRRCKVREELPDNIPAHTPFWAPFGLVVRESTVRRPHSRTPSRQLKRMQKLRDVEHSRRSLPY